VPKLELFGTVRCPYTREMREWLELRGTDFVEFDVESDPPAFERMRAFLDPPYTVPLLVENGKVRQRGWQGRGCVVEPNVSRG
jgi:glutaredoxin